MGVEGVRQVQLRVAQLLPESTEGVLLSLLLLVSLGVQIVGISHSLDDLVGHLDGGPDSLLLVVLPLDGLHLEGLLLFLSKESLWDRGSNGIPDSGALTHN